MREDPVKQPQIFEWTCVRDNCCDTSTTHSSCSASFDFNFNAQYTQMSLERRGNLSNIKRDVARASFFLDTFICLRFGRSGKPSSTKATLCLGIQPLLDVPSSSVSGILSRIAMSSGESNGRRKSSTGKEYLSLRSMAVALTHRLQRSPSRFNP